MTYEHILSFIIGVLIGAILNRSKEDREQERIYEERYREHEENIAYYKKLTRNLVEENSNLKQWEHRHLNVIDSLNTQIKHLESQVYGGSTK